MRALPPSRALPSAPSPPQHPHPRPQSTDAGIAILTSTKAAQLDHLLNQTDMYTKFLTEQMQSIEEKTEAEAAAEAAAAEDKPAKRVRKTSAGASRGRVGSGAAHAGGSADLSPTQVRDCLWPRCPAFWRGVRSWAPRWPWWGGVGVQRRGRRGRPCGLPSVHTHPPLPELTTSQHKRTRAQPQELLPLVKGELRDYQLKGVKWLISLYQNGLNGILADQMGLGKTVQTIGFLSHLKSKGVHGPFLIVGPLSTLPNWVAEVQRWTPSINAVLYHGSKEERAALRAERLGPPSARVTQGFPIVVTSYEIVMADAKFLAHYKWKYVVVDEGHRLKNMNCRLLRELRSIQTANKLLLTGECGGQGRGWEGSGWEGLRERPPPLARPREPRRGYRAPRNPDFRKWVPDPRSPPPQSLGGTPHRHSPAKQPVGTVVPPQLFAARHFWVARRL